MAIRRNKISSYFIVSLICIVISLIVLVSSLTRYISESELRAWGNLLDNFSIIQPKANILSSSILDKLENYSIIERYIPFNDTIIKMPGILNSEYRPVFALKIEDIEDFISFFHAELLEGEFPKKGSREIALSKDIVEARNLKIGDYIGKAIDEDEFLWGRFKISGIIDGKISVGLISFEYWQRRSPQPFSYIAFPVKGKLKEMNRYIINKSNFNIKLETKTSFIKRYREKYRNLNKLILIIIVILTVSLILIIILFVFLFLKNRAKEFALFYSKGIKLSRIILYTIKEISMLMIIGWLLGVCFSQIILYLIKIVVFKKGVFLASIGSREFLLTLPIIFSLIIISILVIVKNLNINNILKEIIGE
ncbi:hypothetical protein [Orenia metallireducens]|uniref:hypothetical protein n=1 Tax=Orenia metallireducens TaxID=1413210 RepID=UPI0011470877|nr:hypothetical protein [Orenia metallireducens]